jgi:hypothetical protein
MGTEFADNSRQLEDPLVWVIGRKLPRTIMVGRVVVACSFLGQEEAKNILLLIGNSPPIQKKCVYQI